MTAFAVPYTIAADAHAGVSEMRSAAVLSYCERACIQTWITQYANWALAYRASEQLGAHRWLQFKCHRRNLALNTEHNPNFLYAGFLSFLCWWNKTRVISAPPWQIFRSGPEAGTWKTCNTMRVLSLPFSCMLSWTFRWDQRWMLIRPYVVLYINSDKTAERSWRSKIGLRRNLRTIRSYN